MFFEAELKDTKYRMNVVEGRRDWKISLQEGDSEWIHYTISKREYQEQEQVILFLFKGSSYILDVTGSDTEYTVFSRGSYRTVKIFNDEMLLHESLKRGVSLDGDTSLRAGMPGKIVQVLVEPGQEVAEGQPLLIMEAMKMENEMRAAKAAVIKDVLVKGGDNVEAGSELISFDLI